MKKICQDQQGLTLIELLAVIVISGILIGSTVKIFQVALISWQSLSKYSQFVANSVKVITNIADDIHEATKFKVIAQKRIIIIKNEKQIRYLLINNRNNVKIVKEVKLNKKSNWEQLPRFPIANFPGDKDYYPQLIFKKKSPSLLIIKIESPLIQFETAIARRCSS